MFKARMFKMTDQHSANLSKSQTLRAFTNTPRSYDAISGSILLLPRTQ
jgi:hypothetical protein